jgi:hypothetical protein
MMPAVNNAGRNLRLSAISKQREESTWRVSRE